MDDTLALVLAWLAGGALGAFFFGGLWWTVRKSLTSARPALWMFGSLLLRMGVTMTGFYFVTGGDWQRLLSCLVGFVMARQLVTRLTRLPEEDQTRQSQEARHAS
ncbi:MAG: ATP synthase subunit I [Rhodoferax sp.]|uniref:ATP synthase subunit I n=1 Tax=Rhodoferax sp. TaxID=50421 RepID=UPI0008D7EFD3|nr:ATP synthase subunit I [Rhodoferax sp.]MDP2679513.1 ATP synthase subunit I [Rhodoferax sp.]OGB51765.1 MAG: ATPase F0F1 [Burkholderiales bacterium RIFOXYD12_FULL_59_19]OGB82876.1 MAG: ATPase F0F1 [Burkholderiales bacterium RIFOXYD2_FULL_59_8]